MSIPDIHGKSQSYAGAGALVLIFIGQTAGLDIPPEVAGAFVLLAGGAVGLARGNSSRQRRSTDNGGSGA